MPVSGAGPRVPRGLRVGDWEVGEPIAEGGWGWVYEGRRVANTDAGRSSTGPTDAGRSTDATDRDRGAGAVDGGHGTGVTDRGRAAGAGDAGHGTGAAGGDRAVALKFMPTAGLAPRQARGLAESARRESEFGRRNRHPRLIRLLDSVVLDEPDHPQLDGAVVLVMERAERSLRQLLEAEGPLARGAGTRILTQICEGLAHLHALGWVHGDLKPDNVLLMADGSVRLSDFGLAAELDGTLGTHAWMPPAGTPDYLPPERWRAPLGERGVQVRPSTDIWALGIMIHQVFTGGSSPFPGATAAARGAAVQEFAAGRAPLRLDPAVPEVWRALAADCLAPAHESRAAHTAQEVLTRVRAAEGDASDAPGDTAPPRRRRRLVLGAVTATALGAATAVGWPYIVADNEDHTAGKGTEVHTENISGTAPAGARVTVFNVEKYCRDRAEARDPICSLGLAVDPKAAYTIDNVVPTRVWHGDVLPAECRMSKGLPVTDEVGTRTTTWYKVRLRDGRAWLPAVRTKDRPAVPECA
ncbi:serine/threonine-protein kinase [Streptomyces griseorubiginosus]|uniref:serine/threonine-protein kinase n=1 Tax=Streptomyces griseorubiginosus TaxID=67304 RepID=UPI00367BEE5E